MFVQTTAKDVKDLLREKISRAKETRQKNDDYIENFRFYFSAYADQYLNNLERQSYIVPNRDT